MAHWPGTARDFDRKMTLPVGRSNESAPKKEAPLKEGLLVLLHGGAADSESSLFAVARDVLGRDVAASGKRKGLSTGCCSARRRAGPVNIA